MVLTSNSDALQIPIISAALFGNTGAVAALIEAGTDVSQTDRLGRTALSYAATHGHMEIVSYLVYAGSPINDGSLHSAAAACHVDVVTFLLQAGHDPNFLSSLHMGQPALEVVLRQGRGEKLRDVFHLLHQSGADASFCRDGKSLLFMALEMGDAGAAIPLMRAFMGKMLNKEFNRYEKDSLIYSPLSYVIHDQASFSPPRKEDLIRIMRLSGCKEVFYHKVGPQPVGFKNAPGALAWEERYREEILLVDPAISWLMEPDELRLQLQGYKAWTRYKHTNQYTHGAWRA